MARYNAKPRSYRASPDAHAQRLQASIRGAVCGRLTRRHLIAFSQFVKSFHAIFKHSLLKSAHGGYIIGLETTKKVRISLCPDPVEDHTEEDLEAALAEADLVAAIAVADLAEALAADRIITDLTARGDLGALGVRADTFSAAGAAPITTAAVVLAA